MGVSADGAVTQPVVASAMSCSMGMPSLGTVGEGATELRLRDVRGVDHVDGRYRQFWTLQKLSNSSPKRPVGVYGAWPVLKELCRIILKLVYVWLPCCNGTYKADSQ